MVFLLVIRINGNLDGSGGYIGGQRDGQALQQRKCTLCMELSHGSGTCDNGIGFCMWHLLSLVPQMKLSKYFLVLLDWRTVVRAHAFTSHEYKILVFDGI